MKALICPVILHDKTVFYSSTPISKIDQTISISTALAIHVAVFTIAGALLIKPPQAGVDRGVTSIEVSLTAAAVPVTETPVVQQIPPLPPVKSEFVEKVTPKPIEKPVEKKTPAKTMAKDAMTAHSAGGAITEAQPDYLKNPAPVYPEYARRRGFEGVVMLTATIDRNGNPVSVGIERSSGHSILDEAALRAVRDWKFRPGRIGNMPIESTVRVPVKFYLDQPD